MSNIQAAIEPGRILRGAGVFGLYGGSVAIALSLMAAGFGEGSASQVAGIGTGAVVNAVLRVMSPLGAVLHLV